MARGKHEKTPIKVFWVSYQISLLYNSLCYPKSASAHFYEIYAKFEIDLSWSLKFS